jgi:quinol monooxygenase YgiN
MSNRVTVVAHVHAKPGKEAAVEKALLELVAHTRREQGCLNYDLHVSTVDPAHFLFYENWTSKADLDRHAQSAHIQAFRARAADLLAQPVDIQLWEMVSQP